MPQLSMKTLSALADLICGDNGPYYRKGYELPTFFRDAGLNCPDHDGAARKWWTLTRLEEYNKDPAQIELVIQQIANPKEYPGNPEALDKAIAQANTILGPEGTQVKLNGIIPRIVSIKPKVHRPKAENSPDTPASAYNPDFSVITNDPELQKTLEKRWREVIACIDNGAFLSAVVMLGSIVEGVLLAMAEGHPREANQASSSPKDQNGKVKNFREWKLNEFINGSCIAHSALPLVKQA